MLTYKLKLKHNIDVSEYLKQYSQCFRLVYNNLELFSDSQFNQTLKQKFPLLDSWFLDSCKRNAKAIKNQTITFKKQNQKHIEEIERLLKENNFKTKREKKTKYRIINKLSYLNRTKNKEIVFGNKKLLQEVTKFSYSNPIKYEEKLKEFQNKRNSYPICSIGEAPQKSNRKYGFDFENKSLIFKPNKDTKIKLEFNCSKKQYFHLCLLQKKIGEMPITILLDNKFVYIVFDEEKLFGYEFDEKNCKLDLKSHPLSERKKIYHKWFKEQLERKHQNKISKRYASVDLNPEFIGFVIKDKDSNKIILKRCYDLHRLNTSLKLSSKDKKQLKQNNKRKYEICQIWKQIFDLCVHYKVGNFVIEDLNFKKEIINFRNKKSNKKVKSLWYKTLTINLIEKYCKSLGIEKIEINPAYSSFVGNLVYEYFDPISSALEICRRGMMKYEKGNKEQFGNIDSMNQEKLNYLLGENALLEEITIPKLFKLCSKSKYRNVLDKTKMKEKVLCSHKSKIILYDC